jgi:hypothetical protein
MMLRRRVWLVTALLGAVLLSGLPTVATHASALRHAPRAVHIRLAHQTRTGFGAVHVLSAGGHQAVPTRWVASALSAGARHAGVVFLGRRPTARAPPAVLGEGQR